MSNLPQFCSSEASRQSFLLSQTYLESIHTPEPHRKLSSGHGGGPVEITAPADSTRNRFMIGHGGRADSTRNRFMIGHGGRADSTRNRFMIGHGGRADSTRNRFMIGHGGRASGDYSASRQDEK